MVSMIPFGLLAGFAGEKEVRIIGLDESGFEFRVRKGTLLNEGKFTLYFWNIETAEYDEINIYEYELKLSKEMLSKEKNMDFFQSFWVSVDQRDYVKAVQRLLSQYSRYIYLKLDDDDSMLAKSLTGYPGELDEVKCGSMEEQIKQWENMMFNTPQSRAGQKNHSSNLNASLCSIFYSNSHSNSVVAGRQFQLAIEADRPELYNLYLANDLKIFWNKCAKSNFNTCRYFIEMGKTPDRLYIGNQFCHHLFPEEKKLFQMMEKASSQHLGITLVFSYVREYMLESVTDLLKKTDKWCEENNQTVEVVINDWGMAQIMRNNTKNLRPCLGTLLNKRKKDPRISYKKGDISLFERNSLNAEFYRKFLEKTFEIQRFEWETCGYEQQFPEGKNSLHIPFYQTNTSQYCPLYAMCVEGKRGRQRLPEKCPKYCDKYAFLYPEHLQMAGRYNSLFGIDTSVWMDEKILEKYIVNGIDRIVLNI